jgi:hypothetical protein
MLGMDSKSCCSSIKLGGTAMTKKEVQFKQSYESDGKMEKKKNEAKKNDNSANFFNVTPDSE